MTRPAMALVTCALFVSGCSQNAVRQHYYGAPDPPAALKAWRTRKLPEGGTPEALRNAQIAKALGQIDANYDTFRSQYFANRTALDTTGDLIGLGLNAAGAAFGGAALKATLAAIAGGIIGARSVLDRDLFAEQSRMVVVLTMDTARAEIRDVIRQSMTEPIDRYPLEVGMQDVERYYQAGTIVSALLALTTQSGVHAQSVAP